MPKKDAQDTEEKDQQKKSASPAGDFAGVRRRGGGAANRAATAAALLGHAENTADASFLGTGQAVPATVVTAPAADPVAPPTPAPAAELPRPATPVLQPATEPTASRTDEDGASDSEEQRQLAVEAVPTAAGDSEQVRGVSGEATLAGAQGPSTVPAAVDGSVETAPARRHKQTKLLPMQQALFDSYLDSRVNSRNWDSHGINLIPALWPALRQRIARDRKNSGYANLGLGHYLDVVLRSAVMDTDYLIGLHDNLHAERMGDVPRGKKTTLSLSPAARANADTLLELLEAADFARKGKDVMSALVLNLLRTLEKEGPLPRPKVPPLL